MTGECCRCMCLGRSGARCRSFAACPTPKPGGGLDLGEGFNHTNSQEQTRKQQRLRSCSTARGKKESEGGRACRTAGPHAMAREQSSAPPALVRAKFVKTTVQARSVHLPLTTKKGIIDARQGGSRSLGTRVLREQRQAACTGKSGWRGYAQKMPPKKDTRRHIPERGGESADEKCRVGLSDRAWHWRSVNQQGSSLNWAMRRR